MPNYDDPTAHASRAPAIVFGAFVALMVTLAAFF